MTKVILHKQGDNITCSHDMANINGDPRTPMLLLSLKTIKNTMKKKLASDTVVIYNTMILTMAKTGAKNPDLMVLHYQDDEKDIFIVAHDTEVELKSH